MTRITLTKVTSIGSFKFPVNLRTIRPIGEELDKLVKRYDEYLDLLEARIEFLEDQLSAYQEDEEEIVED